MISRGMHATFSFEIRNGVTLCEIFEAHRNALIVRDCNLIILHSDNKCKISFFVFSIKKIRVVSKRTEDDCTFMQNIIEAIESTQFKQHSMIRLNY